MPCREALGVQETAVHSASRGRISGAGGFVGPKTPRHTAYVISTLPALDRQALGREQLVAAARGVALSPRCTGLRRPSSARTLPTAQARRPMANTRQANPVSHVRTTIHSLIEPSSCSKAAEHGGMVLERTRN